MTEQISYAILGAFDPEIDTFRDHLKEMELLRWNDYEFWLGKLFDQWAVITKSGVGKVHAAMVTQKIIDTFAPKSFVFTGLAGALNESYEMGDVVVSRDLIQHDFAAHPQFPRYTIPRSNRKDTFHIFEADKDLRARAMAYQPSGHQIYEGRILTGDQFLTRTELMAYKHLIEELKGDAVEMEGAAVAQVCTLNQIPFVVIRTISDKADCNAGVDFNSFLPFAAQNSIGVIECILRGELFPSSI